jgi:hypothetical protein
MKKTLTILLLFLTYTSVYAHPGRTDAKGGHTDEAGEYHSHNEVKEVERDGQYIKYSNGIIYDEKTGLEWYSGIDKGMSWSEAKSWIESLSDRSFDGGGWRMPSKKELQGLYHYSEMGGTSYMTSLLVKAKDSWVWSGETYADSAFGFNFVNPHEFTDRSMSTLGRVFAVRSRKITSIKKEKDYQQDWCTLQHGQIEYVLPDKTRVDCLTEQYAVEFEFASNWAEAIGQSLYYAAMTDKKPGIVLIYEKDSDTKYLDRINKVIDENKLSIRIWVLNKRLDGK